VVRAKGARDELVVEVKRAGLHMDRFVDLELRVGDALIFYLQRALL